MKQLENEIWKPIKNYEYLYEVSNYGRVKSLNFNHTKKEGILKQDGKSYLQVTLFKNKKRNKELVHRLVAEAFIQNPNNLPYINHKDRNVKNNCVYLNKDGTVNLEKTNLEWCTQKYNVNYDGCLERRAIAQRNNNCSKQINQYTLNGEFIKEWPSTKEIQRTLGIHHSNISKCCKGEHKTAGGYIWKFKEAA